MRIFRIVAGPAGALNDGMSELTTLRSLSLLTTLALIALMLCLSLLF